MLFDIQNFLKDHSLDGMYIPKTDKFQGEYLQPHDEILKFICGFSGSAGYAVVTKNQAFLCIDSRYSIQARQEVDTKIWHIIDIAQKPLAALIMDCAIRTLAVDPWLMTINTAQKILKYCSLTPVDNSFFSTLWLNRPNRKNNNVYFWDIKYAGQSSQEKISRIQKNISAPFVMTQPEDICWLLNIRGQDIEYSPLVHAMGILPKDGPVHIFMNLDHVPQCMIESMQEEVIFHSEQSLLDVMNTLTQISFDPSQTPYALMLNRSNITADLRIKNPIAIPKAQKNNVEQKGMRSCHVRDAVAVIHTLHWIDTHPNQETITEMDVSAYLLAQRKKQDLFVSPSFETIAGSGPNGQIVHYKPHKKTNRYLKPDDTFLLIDSGGQYLDGTTDITRTISLGSLTPLQKADFTWVLKGHIALGSAVFPCGTTGAQLDILARQFLWKNGKDYGHGTGHGVGTFLNVHEGPQRISKYAYDTPLELGMVVSNEPGYYDGSSYGIRHESLILVTESHYKQFYTFETLTLVPFDKRAIDETLLTHEEKKWLSDYHQKIIDILQPHLGQTIHNWLKHYVNQ